jgi:hypothetical protein
VWVVEGRESVFGPPGGDGMGYLGEWCSDGTAVALSSWAWGCGLESC